MKRLSLLGLAAFGLANAAFSQVNVSAGLYMPNDGTVRDIFGTNTIAYGFGFGRADRAGREGLGFDFSALGLNATNNRFFMLGGTYGFETHSGKRTGEKTFSYARAGAGFGYYDYSLNYNFGGGNAFQGDGRYLRPLTSIEAGWVLDRKLTLSAQYLLMPDAGNLNFSGFRIQAVLSLLN